MKFLKYFRLPEVPGEVDGFLDRLTIPASLFIGAVLMLQVFVVFVELHRIPATVQEVENVKR
jgi:hypothetical protein